MLKGIYQPTINEKIYSVEISRSITDYSGTIFTIPFFPQQAIIKNIRGRVDWISGQQSGGSALLSGAITPILSSFFYDNGSTSNPFAAGDIIIIGNEHMLVSGMQSANYTINVQRGLNGTIAAYHDDNETITKANNGFRLAIYGSSNMRNVTKILELNNLMSYKSVTNSATSSESTYLTFAADIKNLDTEDIIYLDDGSSTEKAIVEKVNHNVVNAAYDYTIFTRDIFTNTHSNGTPILKEFLYDIQIPYNAGTDILYGKFFADEGLVSSITGRFSFTVDKMV